MTEDDKLKVMLRDAMLKEYDRILLYHATQEQYDKFDRAHVTITLRIHA